MRTPGEAQLIVLGARQEDEGLDLPFLKRLHDGLEYQGIRMHKCRLPYKERHLIPGFNQPQRGSSPGLPDSNTRIGHHLIKSLRRHRVGRKPRRGVQSCAGLFPGTAGVSQKQGEDDDECSFQLTVPQADRRSTPPMESRLQGSGAT